MEYAKQNFARKNPDLKDGDVLRNCNLSQKKAHTAICAGVKNLTFIECNLKNVDIDPSWTVKGGLHDVHEDVPDPQPVVVDLVQDAIDTAGGKDAVLDKIGKDYCKTYFNLKDAVIAAK